MDFESCGPTINTAGRVLRSSVRDLNSYKSVKINSSSKVTNLIIDKFNNVKGVIVNGQQYIADYVILSAGVIGTNELLLRPKFLLEEKKFVEVKIIDGYGIKDHINLRINVAASCKIESLNVINKSLLRKILLGLKHFLGFETLMSGTGATSSANIDIDGDGLVDTRINLLNFSENGRLGSSGQIFDKQPGFSLSITPINPSSTGEVVLNDEGKAILRPGYLNNEADRIALRGAVNYCIELLDSEPLNRYISSIESLEKIKMDIDGYIDENIYSGYHLIGGCQNVVDENFNVVGFKGLYICDASVLGEYVSSNIHSTVAILADLFAKKFMENNRIN
jgi:choline dehydrogenase-like flavoprotein